MAPTRRARPVRPERQRRRHRDDGVDAPEPATGAEPGPRRRAARSRRTRPPAARRLRRSSPGNGWTRRIEPHGVGSRRISRPDQPGSMAWRRYHGRAATTCSSWPRAASSATIRVSTRPVGAVSGSTCGPSTTRRSGRSAIGAVASRAALAGRDGEAVGARPGRGPGRGGRELRGPRQPGGDELVPGGRSRRARPSTRRARAGARARRRRRPRAGRPGRCRSTGVPSAIASSTGAPKPSYSDGNTSASAAASRPSRSAADTRPGRITRGPSSSAAMAAGDVVLDQAATTEQHEGQVGVVPRPGQQVEQEAVVLVGVGQRRVDDVAAGRRGRSARAARPPA